MYDQVRPHPNDHISHRLSLAWAGHQYTPTPTFTPDRENKAWYTNLKDSSLKWAWEDLRQVHKIMQRKDTISKGVRFRSVTRRITYQRVLCAAKLRLRECSRYYKNKPTIESAAVRLLVVFCGIVWAVKAPTPHGKETPKVVFCAEKDKWMMESFLDTWGSWDVSLGGYSRMKAGLERKKPP